MNELVRGLRDRGIPTALYLTRGPKDASGLARKAAGEGADTIVSFGGDGTLNEVVQGVVGTSSALTVCPAGTENVAARELAITTDMGALVDLIATRRTTRIALGRARGEHGDRYFVMFAGIGLDASICMAVNPALKRRFGAGAFWLAGLQHLLTWRQQSFNVHLNGLTRESVFAVIGNGQGYGGGFSFTPEARLDSPSFDVFVLPPRPARMGYLADLVDCARGVPQRATVERASRAVATEPSGPVWVQLDGEVAGRLPMNFDIVADALEVVVPAPA